MNQVKIFSFFFLACSFLGKAQEIDQAKKAIDAEQFDAAKKIFKAKGIRFTHVKEEPNNHSMGFARQTLDYAVKNGIGLIATPSEVVDNGFLMLKSDKELLLTNEQGTPILASG
jgi:hypothetical protein